MQGAGNADVYDATIWVGQSFSVRTAEIPRHHPPASGQRTQCGYSSSSAAGTPTPTTSGRADGTLYAFRVDRSGHLLCALDAPGLADAIMADLSGVPLPGAA